MAVVISVLRGVGLLWPDAGDFRAYWTADLSHLYSAPTSGGSAFLYSPAFAIAVQPLHWLPFSVASGVWTALQLGVIIALAGPWSVLFMLGLSSELISGNVHLLITGAVVLGLRWAPAWAVPFLTKLSPGIGVVWFAFRGEWRAFGFAVGVTIAIAAVAFLLLPQLWFDWAGLLVHYDVEALGVGGWLPIPLLPRLAAAVVAIAWAAPRNARWVLPLAVSFSLPVLWVSGLVAGAAGAFYLATNPPSRRPVAPRLLGASA